MEEGGSSGFDDFSIESADLEMKKKQDLHVCWWDTTDGSSIESRPVIFNRTLIFGGVNQNILCIDMDTFKERWRFKTGAKIVASSPALYKDSVILGSFDRNIYCVGAEDGSLRWKFRTSGEIASPGVIHNGMFFFTGRDMMIYAIDCRDGRLVWKYKTFNSNIIEPTVYGDSVIFCSSDKNLHCLDCASGSLVWKFRADEEMISPSAFPVRDDVLYFGSAGGILYAIDLRTHGVKWKFYTGHYGVSNGGVFLDGMLIQPSLSGVLYALTPQGKVVWRFKKNEGLGGVVTDGDRIYLSGGENDHFYCIDKTGELAWKFRTRAPNWSQAVVDGRFVYFGSYDCSFYKLDKLTGDLVQKFTIPGSVATYPDWKGFFELTVRVSESEMETIEKSKYAIAENIDEQGQGAFYKSRITYGGTSRYREKGKYQSHDDDDEL